MLEIIHYPNTILGKKIQPFDFSNSTINAKNLEKQMLEIMYQNNGIGLSANQVGLDINVFVMGHRDTPELGKAFFNPEVLEVSEDFNDMEEGCLSFPNIFVKIKRPAKILARWQNSNGDWEQGRFEGYDCKCFLHEFDHLQGITFKDRSSNLKWSMAIKKAKKQGKK